MAGSTGQSNASGSTGRYAVKVWYNQAEFHMPGCPPGQLMSYETFKDKVLRPFMLSHQDHKEACTVHITHDSSLPKPGNVVSASNP